MAVRISVAELAELLICILVRHGMSPENAAIIAATVAAAERDGSRSHGLLRVPGYLATLESGWVDGAAVPEVHDVAPGLLLCDAKNGFAQVALAASRAGLIAKARAQGIAALAIRTSHHFAALWPDVEPFAETGFIALAFVNTRSRIVPAPGFAKVLGTNPMALACPREGAPPLVWDQASSVTAQGNVLLARKSGKSVPEGVGVDADGRPTTDPARILDGGSLLAFGGFKGFDIALLVEVMAAALTGGLFGFEDIAQVAPGAQTSKTGECVLLIDPKRSAGAAFAERIERLVERLRAAGHDRLPGDHRYAARERTLREGIAIDEDVYDGLLAMLGEKSA